MGLELVELIMKIEDQFEIVIPDEDVPSLMTARKLVDYIVRKVDIKESDKIPCYSQKAFYTLRRYLVHTFNFKRNEIKPNVLLSDILPSKNRSNTINKIKSELSIKSRPTLTYPDWIQRIIFYSSALLFLIILIIDIRSRNSSLSFLIAAAGSFSFGTLLSLLFKNFKYEIVPRNFTLGDLALELEQVTYWTNTHELLKNINLTRDVIRNNVRVIIAEKLGISLNFSDDDHFIDHFGAG
jgi:acyl carrier protein